MKRYSAFVKDIDNISSPAKCMLEVIRGSSFRIDLLGSVISTINVLSVDENVNIGDLVMVYDNFGSQVYTGVIETIENNSLSCCQMTAFFNDTFPLNMFDTKLSVEEMFSRGVKNFYTNDSFKFYDKKAADLFNSVYFNKCTNTFNNYSFEVNSCINLEEFIFEMYKKNNIKLEFEVNQLSDKININIIKCANSKMKIGDNTSYTTVFNIITETQEINKLIIFGEDGVYRKSYYNSITGITDNSEELLRINQIKTKIVYSNANLDKIKHDNLPNEIYSHSINMSIIQKNNNIISPSEIIKKIGFEFEIWKSGKVYYSILTGYDLKFDGVDIPIINLTFGKIRNRLEYKI